MSTQTLAPWILTYLLHSTLLGGAALLASRSVRNPAAKAWVLRGGLLGALLTASFASWMGQGAQLHLPEAALSQNTAVIGLRGAPNLPDSEQAPAQANLEQAQTLPAQAAGPLQTNQPAPGPLSHWPELLLLAAAAGLLRLARGEWRARRTLASREPAEDPALLARARELAGDKPLAQVLRLSTCAKLSSPLALGLREVVLPLRASELTSGERDALLAHELAHLHRRDPMWLGFGRVLSALFWFQPLHALLMRELEDQTELAADAWAANRTGAPLELARSLERVGTWLTSEYAPATTAAMARSGSPLLERVERLLDNDSSTALRPALGTAAVTALALAVFACAGPAVHEAEVAEMTKNTDLGGEPDGGQIMISLRVVHQEDNPGRIAYKIQGQATPSIEALAPLLERLHAQAPNQAVLIHAQAGTRYGEVVPVLDAIIAAGFTNVSFSGDNDGEVIATTTDRTEGWIAEYDGSARRREIEDPLLGSMQAVTFLQHNNSREPAFTRAAITLDSNGDWMHLPGGSDAPIHALVDTANKMNRGPIPGSTSKEIYPLDRFLIRADRATPFADVARIMALCGRQETSIWRIELASTGEAISDILPVPVPLPTDLHEIQEELEEDSASLIRTENRIKILADGETEFHLSGMSMEQTSAGLTPNFEGLGSVIIDAHPGVSFGYVLDIVRKLVADGVQITFVGPYPTPGDSK
ncbi:MAG: biopolymer transport protein ExbD [Planctomycetota bacterium]|jgi:biopolymer transport protein ExbD